MNRLREKLQDFMEGRNGMDSFSRFLTYVALILFILSLFVPVVNRILFYIGVVVLVYAYFRVFSRNTAKRYLEDQKFSRFIGSITGGFRNTKRAARDKDHRYFKCPGCAQTVRVPRGKGKIQIRCPKCGREFIKNT